VIDVPRQLAAALRSRRAAEERSLEVVALMQAELFARDNDRREVKNLADVEFRVFSQFGDDGILQYLTRKLKPADSFVEIGAADYREASTRLLLLKDNWRGMVVDSSPRNAEAIRSSPIYWRHDLTAVAAFVSAENVNSLLERNGFTGDVGVLIVDVDGNDYWVWAALNAVRPLIVGIEYNSVFGPERAVCVPYDPAFERRRAHPSNLYWGASLAALANLGARLGYRLVGSNEAGNNAYFVAADAADGLPSPSAADAWRESRFRESRDESEALTYLAGKRRLAAIADMPLLDLDADEPIRAGDLLGTY
jgi:hypothetical protein